MEGASILLSPTCLATGVHNFCDKPIALSPSPLTISCSFFILKHAPTCIPDIAYLFVTSRLDYVNSALYGISAKNIHRLQRMQNTLARVVLGSSASKFSHSTDMLRYLHWLPVEYRIKFKLAKLVFNTRNTSAPLYLTCLLDGYVPGRSLRSSQSNLLTVPSYRLNFGARSFRVAAPMFGTLFLQTFVHVHCTCHLETFYFYAAFN